MTWNKLYFNKQNIERESERAVLIKLPSSSNYAGWMLWHPSKLIREEGGNGYFLSLSFTDDWSFRLFKNYKNKPNPEQMVEPKEIIEAFKGSDEMIRSQATESSDSYLEVIEPKPITKEVEVDESLKR